MTASGLVHPFAPPEPGAAVEVAEGVLWMRLPLPMALNHVNVYALDDGDGWTLVDAGSDWAGCREGWARLLGGPLAGRPLRRLIVTHHHPDHVGCAAMLMARGAELLMTRTAWLFARMLTLDHQDRPTPQQLAFLRRAGWEDARLAAYAAAEPFNFSRCVQPLPAGFTRLADGDALAMGGRRWRVRLGGGHAPDQATLFSEDGALALTADQVLPRISPNIGVYPTEPDADPLVDWLETCARLRSALAAEPEHARLALPGHERPFTGLGFRLRQLEDNHHGALRRLRAALAERPASAVECFGVLYGRTIGDGEYGLATAEAVAHLNHLRAAGLAEAAEDADGALRFRARAAA